MIWRRPLCGYQNGSFPTEIKTKNSGALVMYTVQLWGQRLNIERGSIIFRFFQLGRGATVWTRIRTYLRYDPTKENWVHDPISEKACA
jgi:hypothetical protein